MGKMVMVTKETGLDEIVKMFHETDVEEVLIKSGMTNGKDIEISLHYYKERKKFLLGVQPMEYKVERGMVSRSYELFTGTSVYLNDIPIARKAPKYEKMARETITEELLKGMFTKVKA